MALNAQILLSILAHETSTGDLSKTLRATPASYSASLTDGTGANQAQVVWSGSRVAAGTDTLQLSALSDTRDGAVVTVNITAVKAMCFRNTHASNPISVGVVSPSTSLVRVEPGGAFVIVAPTAGGIASGVGSANTHFITATAGTTYDIVLIGEGSVT